MNKIITWSKHNTDNAFGYLCTTLNKNKITIKKYIDDLINNQKDVSSFSAQYMYNKIYGFGKLIKVNNRRFKNDTYDFSVSFED